MSDYLVVEELSKRFSAHGHESFERALEYTRGIMASG